MKLFNSIDEKLEKLGFKIVSDDIHHTQYKRIDKKYKFCHIVYLAHKKHLNSFVLQSYDKDLFDEKKIGNTCVALSTEELKLFIKKMKWKEKEYRRWRMW